MNGHVLDCRGMAYPMPIVELSKKARSLARGETIEVIADDDGFPGDFRNWCALTGNDFVGLESADGEHRGTVRLAFS